MRVRKKVHWNVRRNTVTTTRTGTLNWTIYLTIIYNTRLWTLYENTKPNTWLGSGAPVRDPPVLRSFLLLCNPRLYLNQLSDVDSGCLDVGIFLEGRVFLTWSQMNVWPLILLSIKSTFGNSKTSTIIYHPISIDYTVDT